MVPFLASSQCVDIDIVVLEEPFCPGSFNGGQLQAVVTNGSGLYSYQWLDMNGDEPPGGEQLSQTTFGYLLANHEYWVYVTDENLNCTDSMSYQFTSYTCEDNYAQIQISNPFTIDTVGYNIYSECEVTISNLGCQVDLIPQFIISHDENLIEGMFSVEYFNAQSVWEPIDYYINVDGDAVANWSNIESLNCESTQIRPVRIVFNQLNPSAPQGEYEASLSLYNVNEFGNLNQQISDDYYTSIFLLDTLCQDFILKLLPTDESCYGENDGQIDLQVIGGTPPYIFSLNDSDYSSQMIYPNLSAGNYFAESIDANGCLSIDDGVVDSIPAFLPDTLIFQSSSNMVIVNWIANDFIDGYKFRFRKTNDAWQVVASGIYDNNVPEMLSNKQIFGLVSDELYEIQVKINTLSDCEEGWSSSYFFNTTSNDFNYVANNSCFQSNNGSVVLVSNLEFQNYQYEWFGPNGFESQDNSIQNLIPGQYSLSVIDSLGFEVYDSTFIIDQFDETILSLTYQNYNNEYVNTDGILTVEFCSFGNLISYSGSDLINPTWSNGLELEEVIVDSSEQLFINALDPNLCPIYSDTIDFIVVDDFVDLVESQQTLQEEYHFCQGDSEINLVLSEFYSENYNWYWINNSSNDTIGNEPSFIINSSVSQSYTLSIQHCTLNFDVVSHENPSILLQTSDVLCNGDNTGSIYVENTTNESFDLYLNDSQGSLVFLFDDFTIPLQIQDLNAGSYLLELSNEWGCGLDSLIDITEPSQLSMEIVELQEVSCLTGNGGATISISGGTIPYSIYLQNELMFDESYDFDFGFDDLPPSFYTAVAIDSVNCSTYTVFEILDLDGLIVSNNSSDSINCYGDSIANFDFEVLNAIEPIAYILTYPDLSIVSQDSGVFSNLPSGEYQIVVSDAQNCEVDSTFIIYENDDIFVTTQIVNNEIIILSPTNENPSFGVPPYSYYWYNELDQNQNVDTNTFSPIENGVYYSIVYDSLNCFGVSEYIDFNSLSVNHSDLDVNLPYPNPFNDFLKIESYNSEDFQVKIFDSKLSLLISENCNSQCLIDVSYFHKGVYFIHYLFKNNAKVYKIIKQ